MKPNLFIKRVSKTASTIALLSGVLNFTAGAADVTEVTGQGNNDWNASAPWGALPTGGNNYITTTAAGSGQGTLWGVSGIAGRIRVNNANSTFSGGSLTVSAGTEVLLKGEVNNSSVYESANWIMNGGMIRWGANGVTGGATNVVQGTLNVAANSYVTQGRLPSTGQSWLDLATTITGPGGLTLLSGSQSDYASSATGLTFQITGDLSGYDGMLTLGNGTLTGEILELDPSSTSMSSATLNLASHDATTTVQFDEAVTLGGFTIGGSAVAPGTYTPAQLNALGDGPDFTGTGEVTVVPEPASMVLFGAGLAGLLAVYRKAGTRKTML